MLVIRPNFGAFVVCKTKTYKEEDFHIITTITFIFYTKMAEEKGAERGGLSLYYYDYVNFFSKMVEGKGAEYVDIELNIVFFCSSWLIRTASSI